MWGPLPQNTVEENCRLSDPRPGPSLQVASEAARTESALAAGRVRGLEGGEAALRVACSLRSAQRDGAG